MSSQIPAGGADPSADVANVLTPLYAQAGQGALVGAFVAGDPSSRAAVLDEFRFQPLPEDLLSAALEVRGDEVLWSLSHRRDLPADAIHVLIEEGTPLVHRMLASNPRLTSQQLSLLLPGDEFVRSRVFSHPNAHASVRLAALGSFGGQGGSARLSPTFTDELSKPQYAVWLLRNGIRVGQSHPLEALPALPPAYQWDLAQGVVNGQIPLEDAVAAKGWSPALQSMLAAVESESFRSGAAQALNLLSDKLSASGRPALTAVEEARVLADVSLVEALTERVVDWDALMPLVRDGSMTPAALHVLMRRADRPSAFVTAAIVRFGDEPGILAGSTLEDLHAAVTMSGFSPTDRSRLTALLVSAPELPYGFLELVRGLAVADVFKQLSECDPLLRQHQLSRLAEDLRERFGSEPGPWFEFEQARRENPRISFEAAVARAVAAR